VHRILSLVLLFLCSSKLCSVTLKQGTISLCIFTHFLALETDWSLWFSTVTAVAVLEYYRTRAACDLLTLVSFCLTLIRMYRADLPSLGCLVHYLLWLHIAVVVAVGVVVITALSQDVCYINCCAVLSQCVRSSYSEVICFTVDQLQSQWHQLCIKFKPHLSNQANKLVGSYICNISMRLSLYCDIFTRLFQNSLNQFIYIILGLVAE